MTHALDLLVSVLAVLTTAFALPQDLQAALDILGTLPRQEIKAAAPLTSNSIQNIAIIGSGITGAVAAFELAENGRLRAGGPPQITIFERNPIIGGRVTTTQVYGDPLLTIDTCAISFDPLVDTCSAGAATDVGLTTIAFQQTTAGVGIWDGTKIVGLVEDEGFRNPIGWTAARKARWHRRYGNIPFNFSQVANQQQTTFGMIGQDVFTSLISEIIGKDFEEYVLGNVEDFLTSTSGDHNELFVKEVLEASVRERFFNNISSINAVEGWLSFADETSLQAVSGGNLRLIDRLIKLSGATVQLSTNMTNVNKGAQPGWTVEYSVAGKSAQQSFDAVVIAAPIALANVTFKPSLQGLDSSQRYVDTYVTHFTSAGQLNSTFFDISKPGPQNILTTDATSNTTLPFLSLVLLDSTLKNPQTKKPENLYKLVSRFNVSDEELGLYIERNTSLTEPAVTWIDRKPLLDSVPILEKKRVIQNQIEVAPGLFYVGGGESVAATIEFGCRMGRNAARLIIPEPTRGRQ